MTFYCTCELSLQSPNQPPLQVSVCKSSSQELNPWGWMWELLGAHQTRSSLGLAATCHRNDTGPTAVNPQICASHVNETGVGGTVRGGKTVQIRPLISAQAWQV